MMLTTSKAWQIARCSSGFIVSNILTGRRLSVANHIGELLFFCETPKKEENIAECLNEYIPSDSIDGTMSILLRKKLLVSDESDMFVDTKPAHPTLWGCALSISSYTRIVIVGAPFGWGNAVDVRCKEFPMHLRSYIWGYYSFRKQTENLDRLNPATVSPWFNLSNFKEIVRNNSIADIGDILFYRGETSEMFYARMEKISQNIIQSGLLPIYIGGDHSITFPIVAAINKENMPFVVLHFDAHADMKDGAVMKLHERLGYKLVNHANVIKRILDFNNVVHIYQIGVREPFLYDDKKITRISVRDINNPRWPNIFTELNMPVYLTFDVDFFDPSLAPGTASVLPEGGDYENTFKFLAQILKHKRVLGMDIVEANLTFDIRNKTTLLVNNLLMHIISQIEL